MPTPFVTRVHSSARAAESDGRQRNPTLGPAAGAIRIDCTFEHTEARSCRVGTWTRTEAQDGIIA
jgi:hypothetical protein